MFTSSRCKDIHRMMFEAQENNWSRADIQRHLDTYYPGTTRIMALNIHITMCRMEATLELKGKRRQA